MQLLYNLLIQIASYSVVVVALFNPKLKLFYQGRKETFSKLQKNIDENDKVIWMHCASLGEFEQGRPLFEKLKLEYPNYKMLLSFFSPSGYEVRKDYKVADVIVYLPLDSPENAKRFIEIAHPHLSIFVKYEIWPNLLKELLYKRIKTILISGIFREEQLFFKKNTNWYRKTLAAFTHFFVQDKNSEFLLRDIGLNNVSIVGDTRFDRVHNLVSQKKELPFIANFTKKRFTLVAGSTWQKDEELLVDYINNFSEENERFIIAPHNIKSKDISELRKKLKPKTLLYSQITTECTNDTKVLIIDSIGLLTSVYNYGDVAYVGGGFGTGIHNILEPATYGMPTIIGPNYKKFKEAVDLIEQNACFVIHTKEDLKHQLKSFINTDKKASIAASEASKYIAKNIGATEKIMEYIREKVKE